jgi:hypothetical protein
MLPHEEQSGRFLRRPQQDYPAATVADFCTAVLTGTRLREDAAPGESR